MNSHINQDVQMKDECEEISCNQDEGDDTHHVGSIDVKERSMESEEIQEE